MIGSASAQLKTVTPVVIAFSCDQKFVPHTGTTILSVLKNAAENRLIEIIILDGGISAESREQLAALAKHHPACSFRFLSFEGQFEYVARHQNYGPANYYRILLPSSLPEIDKVLYLDSDLIVLDDICRLFDTDMDEYSVAACHDLGMKVTMKEEGRRTGAIVGELLIEDYYSNYVGLKNENFDSYFNSGVLLMNLKKLRDDRFEARCQDLLKSKDGKFWFVDQDIFNRFFQGNYLELDLTWNVQTWSTDWAEQLAPEFKTRFLSAREKPRIVHFVAKFNKPWAHPEVDFAELYWQYLKETDWYDEVQSAFKNGEKTTAVARAPHDRAGIFGRLMRWMTGGS